MHLYDYIDAHGWLNWESSMVMDGEGRHRYAVGLKDQIQAKFEDIHCSEVALAKLETYEQGTLTMDEFITNFDNLKIKAQISNDYTKTILSKNVRYHLYNALVMQIRESEDYMVLQVRLLKIGQCENIVKLTCGSCPSPFQKKPQQHSLPQGTPMDIDCFKQLGQAQGQGGPICFSYGKFGHIA